MKISVILQLKRYKQSLDSTVFFLEFYTVKLNRTLYSNNDCINIMQSMLLKNTLTN